MRAIGTGNSAEARVRFRISVTALGLLMGALPTTVVPRVAMADEPVAASEPRLMSETSEITSVVDAFDSTDPFDVHFLLGFEQSWKTANIRRETALFQPGLSTGGFVAHSENVAKFSQSTSTLNMGADVGIFRDLALVFRLPLILSDSRELSDLGGSSKNPQRLQDPNGEQLFSVPFKSPNRSGVDYFSAGLDYAIMNQQRDWTKPTWVVGVEGRFGIGTPLHACNDNPAPGAQKCPDPANAANGRDPGISRGMTSLGVHTVFSRRFGYVEPYSGFWFLADFPHDQTDYGATSNLKGSLLNHPPLTGKFVMGLEIIPWERKEQFQRLVFDARFSGTYHSPGREYSELFDALGTSQAHSLRDSTPSAYHDTGNGNSVADPNAQKVYFSGITDQQAYGSFGGQAGVTWQAGEYLKFNAGGGVTFVQSHLITASDSCNPDFKGDVGASGPCHGVANGGAGPQPITGIPNPNHRDVIDLPGRRFSADDTTIVNLWINGVVMF